VENHVLRRLVSKRLLDKISVMKAGRELEA
jgi:hypothetical protein